MKNIPVIDRRSGRLMGHVQRVVSDVPGKRIAGLVLELPTGLKKQAYLERKNIWVMSRSCVIAREDKLLAMREVPVIEKSYQYYSAEGRPQGRINDYLIDSGGSICGFEVCKSLYEDVKNGREILLFTGNLMIAEDRVQAAQTPMQEENQ